MMFYRVLLGHVITMQCLIVLLGIRIIILLEISYDLRDSGQDSKDLGKIRKIRARFVDSKEIPGAVNVLPNRVGPLDSTKLNC